MRWRILPPTQVKVETEYSPLESTMPLTSDQQYTSKVRNMSTATAAAATT